MAKPMIQRTVHYMRKNFEKIRYTFKEIPKESISLPYGIYVNVPFCLQLCEFCPFYKELYSKTMVEKYIDAIINEIQRSSIEGTPNWIYFGGGTPNVLTIPQLKRIVHALDSKITINNMGLEALPTLLTKEYIQELKELGFKKLSIGVETLQPDILKSVGRNQAKYDQIPEMLKFAQDLGMFTNVDMLIGLKHQKQEGFLKDISHLCEIHPSQITIYPYMAIRGLVSNSQMPDELQFAIIEKSWKIISEKNYTRRGPWTFTNTSDLYDSSRDELVEDYIGFGPGAFSGYGRYRYVNPPLDLYLHYWEPSVVNVQPHALVSVNDPESIEWRRLARMIGDLHIDPTYKFSRIANFVLSMLKLTGYIRKNDLTKKGMDLAHHLMKNVVENLPFPLQNPAVISNYPEYKKCLIEQSQKKESQKKTVKIHTSA